MSGDFEWNDETRSRLRDLWAEGHSGSEIARRMGVSKNSVVGKAHRLNLLGRPSPIRTRNPGDPVKPKIKRAPKVTLGTLAGPSAPHPNPRPERKTPAARVVPHGQHWLPIKGATLR